MNQKYLINRRSIRSATLLKSVPGMNNGKRVLVTGAAGYIGSVLVRQLLEQGYQVLGVDTLLFGGESVAEISSNPQFELCTVDIRHHDAIGALLSRVDGIIHLAAIVGDPACTRQPKLAEETNWVASKALFDQCWVTDTVKRFIFVSTCSNYGKMSGSTYVNETSELKPISLYAELKVKFELLLLNSPKNGQLISTSLRFATAYGLSPRTRFDLTINEFARETARGTELEIYGEQFWRPYCHVQDLARACILALEAPAKVADHEVFNVGDTQENYTKSMVADLLREVEPQARIAFVHKDEDPRDYKVNFSKIQNGLDFRITKTVRDGIREIYDAIKAERFADPYDPRHSNTPN